MNSINNDEYLALAEQTADSEEIFDGIVLHVFRDSVTLPNGGSAVREVIRHIGAVCIVPVTEEGNIVLERQYRYPVNRVVTEIPAGKLDYPDEDRLNAARRELKEETGYTAENWRIMGEFVPAIAYSDELITMYLATGLKKGSQALDEDEFLNVFEMPLADALDLVMKGQIADSKTQTGILKAAMILGICRKGD